MKICFLTQTADKLPGYYIDFFKGRDLYYLTFRTPSPDALAFLPNSSWAEGRNTLWEKLKDKYDYYVFMDDDLIFFNFNRFFLKLPFLPYMYYRFKKKLFSRCFEEARPNYFFSRLEYYLTHFSPEVLSITDLKVNSYEEINKEFLKRDTFVRRLGYFDPQFSVFSNYAASKVLPYDTSISGWWSSQIPIYLYAYHVFGKKAIDVIDLGVVNFRWAKGNYFPGYDGYNDCKLMLTKISNVTNKDYLNIAGPIGDWPVNNMYGEGQILGGRIRSSDYENYKLNYERTLKGLEEFLHQHIIP